METDMFLDNVNENIPEYLVCRKYLENYVKRSGGTLWALDDSIITTHNTKSKSR